MPQVVQSRRDGSVPHPVVHYFNLSQVTATRVLLLAHAAGLKTWRWGIAAAPALTLRRVARAAEVVAARGALNDHARALFVSPPSTRFATPAVRRRRVVLPPVARQRRAAQGHA